MVASFTPEKDYDLFFKIAEYIISLRDNITFIGAGGPRKDESVFKRLKYLAKGNPMILFPGRINDVEALVNACDIGILLTNKAIHGEGIPNSVLEYMALGKAVIANDAGGTKELVRHNENGYLVTSETFEGIAEMILEFIDDPEKRKAFGKRGKEIIDEYFTLEKIGKAFEKIYCELHN
jgi:glycosyltransferase involved in cell wall biosynthesis